MKRILSIDFDIIMYPCIRLYNDVIGGNQNPTEVWNYLSHERDIDTFVNYDAKVLETLVKIIKNQNAHGIPLFLCKEHQHIVDHLRNQEDYTDQTYSIVNVDHHHDIWYRPEDKGVLTNFDDYNCSNWLGYLLLRNKTEHVVWFKAYNSQPFEDKSYEPVVFNNIFRLDELDMLIGQEFDAIYLVLSPQWVPYKFHHLYNILATVGEGQSI